MVSLKNILAVSAITLSLTACSSVHYSAASAPLQSTLHTHQVADLEIGAPVSASASDTLLFGFISLGSDNTYADGVNYTGNDSKKIKFLDSASKVKAAAAYKAVSSAKADVLVAPIYFTKESNFILWKNIKATVRAYPANIKGIRNAPAPYQH